MLNVIYVNKDGNQIPLQVIRTLSSNTTEDVAKLAHMKANSDTLLRAPDGRWILCRNVVDSKFKEIRVECVSEGDMEADSQSVYAIVTV